MKIIEIVLFGDISPVSVNSFHNRPQTFIPVNNLFMESLIHPCKCIHMVELTEVGNYGRG